MQRIELLAPAGDMECLYAAVAAGADAIYVGGKRFGARAFAKNFDIDELRRAVNYCHLHGVKLYVTLNTLIEDIELRLAVEYADRVTMLYDLDMSRGKPSAQQLDLSMDLLRIDPAELVHSRDGIDVRNYGYLPGIAEARELFAELLEVSPENVLIGGQSSLSLMYDCFANAMLMESIST